MSGSNFLHYSQLDAMDCGATCLRMIAKFYGKSFTSQTLRQRSYITREGVSLLGISDAAKSIGMHTIGVKTSLENFGKEIVILDITGIVYKLREDDIHIYPNPVISNFYIKLPAQDKNINMIVYSQYGKELIHDSIPSGSSSYTLDVHQLNPGNYVLKISNFEKRFIVVK